MTLLALIVPAAGVQASQLVSPEAARTALTEKAKEKFGDVKVDSKTEKRFEKKFNKLKKKLAKKDIDFNDPVDKWLWLWLISWGAAIVFGVIAYAGTGIVILATLSWLLWLAGSVFFIIWLVKKFS
jgi:Flp pilus assembly protein TadB